VSKKAAALAFLGVCAVLSALLVAGVISPIWSGAIFAVSLVIFGIFSHGFTNKK
jgi:hypothetical protein